MKNLRALSAVLGILLMAISAQAAESIGINFCDAASQFNVDESPGIVSGQNWNNIVGTNGANYWVANAVLNDSTGNSTAARLSINSVVRTLSMNLLEVSRHEGAQKSYGLIVER